MAERNALPICVCTDRYPHKFYRVNGVTWCQDCGHRLVAHGSGSTSDLTAIPDPAPAESTGVPSMEDVLAVEPLCELMHDAYEKAAVGAGWETNPASRKPWSDVPEANKATMRAAVSALVEHVTAGLASVLAEARAEALEQAADERAARKIAGDAADRFRDVLSEVLGLNENPGDDALVATIRERHGKTGPEPTRWRDFCTSALAHLDQINASDRTDR